MLFLHIRFWSIFSLVGIRWDSEKSQDDKSTIDEIPDILGE